MNEENWDCIYENSYLRVLPKPQVSEKGAGNSRRMHWFSCSSSKILQFGVARATERWRWKLHKGRSCRWRSLNTCVNSTLVLGWAHKLCIYRGESKELVESNILNWVKISALSLAIFLDWSEPQFSYLSSGDVETTSWGHWELNNTAYVNQLAQCLANHKHLISVHNFYSS